MSATAFGSGPIRSLQGVRGIGAAAELVSRNGLVAYLLVSLSVGGCLELATPRDYTVSFCLLFGLLAVATVTDFHAFKIPNAITYPTIVAALLLAFAADGIPLVWRHPAEWLSPLTLRGSALGLAAGFGVMAIVFAFVGRGAGDVKLAAAVGALVGPAEVLQVIVVAHLLAGLFSLGWIVVVTGPLKLLSYFALWIGSVFWLHRVDAPVWPGPDLASKPVPMAGFFAAGTFLTLGVL